MFFFHQNKERKGQAHKGRYEYVRLHKIDNDSQM